MKTTPRFPRLRALLRALTSPRRVGFWAVTFPVLMAPVALYSIMRPGVKFEWSAKLGPVWVEAFKWDERDGGQLAVVDIRSYGCRASAFCLVPLAGQPVLPRDAGLPRLGPLLWNLQPNSKEFTLVVRRFGLGATFGH